MKKFTQNQLNAVANENYLDVEGFKHPGAFTFNLNCRVGKVNAICEWIGDNLKSTQTITSAHSYSLKHVCEKEVTIDHGWVGNGEFIAAAILMGYKFKRNGRLNCYFNISLSSITILPAESPSTLVVG